MLQPYKQFQFWLRLQGKQWKGDMLSPFNTNNNHFLIFKFKKWTEITVINRKVASFIETTKYNMGGNNDQRCTCPTNHSNT